VRRLSCALGLTLCVAASAQDRPRPNLLLITLDAVRADRVTAKLTPSLDALAARGTRFERTYAHAPLTLPAHASILTGLLPPAHGVRNNGFRLDAAVTTLAEMLAAAGYRTGAFVGSSALDARFGLAQGFEEYDDRYDLLHGPAGANAFRQGARRGAAVLAAASAWIARQSEPWFAWAHVRDAHAPYVSYDHSVAAADAAIGAFLDAPAIAAFRDRTVVVVTSDHGEMLGEHGERTHGLFAYEGAIRVPLILAGPGIPQ
jgi:choline-sulfatase